MGNADKMGFIKQAQDELKRRIALTDNICDQFKKSYSDYSSKTRPILNLFLSALTVLAAMWVIFNVDIIFKVFSIQNYDSDFLSVIKITAFAALVSPCLCISLYAHKNIVRISRIDGIDKHVSKVRNIKKDLQSRLDNLNGKTIDNIDRLIFGDDNPRLEPKDVDADIEKYSDIAKAYSNPDYNDVALKTTRRLSAILISITFILLIGTSYFARSERILSRIPYYGDIGKCRLSAEQALTYADFIQTVDIKNQYCSSIDEYTSDGFYPVLLDVSDNGIPLLLIVVGNPPNEYGMFGFDSCSHYLLYGYKNGKIQEIKAQGNLGLLPINGERLLVFENKDWVEGASYGSKYYRIKNGTPELVLQASAQYWVSDWGVYNITIDGRKYVMDRSYYFINGKEVNEKEFQKQISDNRNKIETLLVNEEVLSATKPFLKYLSKTHTRNQVAQVFQTYANSIIER